ncbi:MAG TPA: hypothetical protein VN496_01680 [Burkholderiales bacterium]|nr:hypothetical protein [Burkholderiales bacterium]
MPGWRLLWPNRRSRFAVAPYAELDQTDFQVVFHAGRSHYSEFDWRSFVHNIEIDAVVPGDNFARQLHDMFAGDLRESARIDADTWRRCCLGVRIKEVSARLWEYWL